MGYWKKMSTSRHTHQIVHDALGCYIGIGMEDPEMPHQFPLQPPNPPTAPTPIEANTFVHIPDSPTHSPSPFQFPPQEVITQTLEEHPWRNVATQPQGLLPCPEQAPPTLGKSYNSWYKC